jgi:hypothetical protein
MTSPPDNRKPSPLELGLYARGDRTPRITGIEIAALALTLVWILAVVVFGLGTAPEQGSGGLARSVLGVLAVLLPVALIWVAAMAARTARLLRQEASRLQASIDAMRVAYVEQQQGAALNIEPDLVRRLEELIAAQQGTGAPLEPATFTSLRALAPPQVRAAMADPSLAEVPQPVLDLAQPALREPISVVDFIKAMDFPENEHDKEGFRALRLALEDPATERLIRASQDVLTLISQDGIYMDDLTPDRARPEVWRRFAQGERGRAIAALGGIHDRSSLVLTAGRMKKDPVFRDAAHHFLRNFDRTFMEFEKHASDEEIARLSDTRTARAFMLLGRVTGTFD